MSQVDMFKKTVNLCINNTELLKNVDKKSIWIKILGNFKLEDSKGWNLQNNAFEDDKMIFCTITNKVLLIDFIFGCSILIENAIKRNILDNEKELIKLSIELSAKYPSNLFLIKFREKSYAYIFYMFFFVVIISIIFIKYK